MKRDKNVLKGRKAKRRKLRVRKKVYGTATCPRLAVFRSGRHIYAQLIDDDTGRSLTAVSSLSPEFRAKNLDRTGNLDAAYEVGRLVAEKAKALSIRQVRFDRRSYVFHGRVKALAAGAREGGLRF